MSARADVPHYVYRYYDEADRLLYVGCTNSPLLRRRSHSKDSEWFADVARVRHTVFPNRRAALDREAAAIHLEKPLHNVKGRWRPGHSRDHWQLEDYRAFLWATIAVSRDGASARKSISEIVHEARDRFGVTQLRTAS